MSSDSNGNGNGDNTDVARTESANGHHDIEHKQQQKDTIGPLIRSPFRAMVQDFSPIWFTWCMNSGIIGILLHQHPYQFHGIRTLSIIAFVVDLVLFVVFSTIFILRFAMFRGQAYNEISSDPSQLPLTACWVIGYLTLPPLIAFNVSQAYWGGYWASLFAYVLWWIGALLTFSVLFWVFSVIARRHLEGVKSDDRIVYNGQSRPVPPLIIIPAVAIATCAITGVEVVAFGSHMNARLAVPVIIISFPLVGLAIVLACFIYAILWRQLLETGFPAPGAITSLFVWVGPFGQCGAALQAAGSAAVARFGEYNSGTFITEQSARALDAACVLSGLLLVGPGAFFILYSIYATIDAAITTRKVKWSPSWNAVIFPSATVTTSTTFLATDLDSPTFRVLTSIQLVLLVIMFFVNVVYTIMGIAKGELLIVREDPRVKKQMQEQQKEK